MPHSSTPIGVPSKTRTHHFDRQLSLAIDAAHYELDWLASKQSLWALWRRFCLRRQLRKLEAQVPQ